MTIKEKMADFFGRIARRLGKHTEPRPEVDVHYDEPGINPTAIGAAVVANIAIDDSDLIITGESARADVLREIADYYTDALQKTVAEVALGTGECIVRPYTDGRYIGMNIIPAEGIAITESIGDQLRGVIMLLDTYQRGASVYRLFESQNLRTITDAAGQERSAVEVRRYAYKDSREVGLGETNWATIVPEETVGADRLLLGRYKCPTVNRNDVNSAQGVPITYGCEDIIDEIRAGYKQYNDEFKAKRALLFADRTLFLKDGTARDAGEKYKLGGPTFIKMNGGLEHGVASMVQEYSPAIREAEYKAGSNYNLAVLEMCCGFSRGVFTAPETAFATATEMKNSLKKTFSFVKTFRRRLERGDNDLFYAVDVLLNLIGRTPVGDWGIRHEWSYDYIEQTQEKFNQLLQAHSAGAVKTSDVTAWVLDMPREEAEAYVAEIAAEADAPDDAGAAIDDGAAAYA